MHRFIYLSLVLSSASLAWSMGSTTPHLKTTTVFQPLTLQQLCIHKIRTLVTNMPALTSFEHAFKLAKSQQESAAFIERTLPAHLVKLLKEQILYNYKSCLDGPPWYTVDPAAQTEHFCLETKSSKLCDYSSVKKLVATVLPEDRPILAFYNVADATHERSLLCALDVSRYGTIESISFSPQGTYLVLTYSGKRQKNGNVLIPIIPDVPVCMHQLHFKLPSQSLHHSYTTYFSPDDRYVIERGLHEISIFDVSKIAKASPESFVKISSIVRNYKELIMNPTNYQFAARDYEGNIEVFSITKNNRLQFIGNTQCLGGPTKFQWMPCGTKILIQEGENQFIWRPSNDSKVPLNSQLPTITAGQVAHSKCQKYMAYRSTRGLCVLNTKTQYWSRIENYHPERISFDDTNALIGIEAHGKLSEYRGYEYCAVPLEKLILLCWISKNICHAPTENNLVQLLTSANAMCGQPSFNELPQSIREELVTLIYKKIQAKLALKDSSSSVVININDMQRSFVIEFSD